MRGKLAVILGLVTAFGAFGAAGGSSAHATDCCSPYDPPTVHVSDNAGASTTFAFNGTRFGSDHLVSVTTSDGASCVYLGPSFGYWWDCPGTMQWELNLRDGADTVSGTADQHVHIFAMSNDDNTGTRMSGAKKVTIGSRQGALKVEGGTSNDTITLTEEMVYPGTVDGGPGDDSITGVLATHAPLEAAVDDLNGGAGIDTIADYDHVKDTINCGWSDGAKDNVYRDKNATATDALTNCGNDNVHNNASAP
jgi:hypothetical protein